MSESETGLSYWTKNVKDPRDPVGKIKLSDLMNYDARATYKHKMLWEFHLGWSHADYEHTSLASGAEDPGHVQRAKPIRQDHVDSAYQRRQSRPVRVGIHARA